MSRYRVLYVRELTDDLTDLWIAADHIGNRVLQELTASVDRRLAGNPLAVGRSVGGDELVREWRATAFNSAVRIRFDVFPTQREVEVTLITLTPPAD